MALTPNLPVDVARIIQLAVAPVFLLSGVGVTLTLFTNRLARIVDRARILEDRLAEDPHVDLHEALAVLAQRAPLHQFRHGAGYRLGPVGDHHRHPAVRCRPAERQFDGADRSDLQCGPCSRSPAPCWCSS